MKIDALILEELGLNHDSLSKTHLGYSCHKTRTEECLIHKENKNDCSINSDDFVHKFCKILVLFCIDDRIYLVLEC